jgi:adenine phosphoribosyltransferase
MVPAELKKKIREVPDFPRPGINFYDVSTLFRDAAAFRAVVEQMARPWRDDGVDALVGIEARGFVLASALAYELGLGLVLVRKLGKLPGRTEGLSYELEYGEAHLEIHTDAIRQGQSVVVVDDLLATGGTAAATGRLVERLGGVVRGFAFMVELGFLGGRERLGSGRTVSLLHYAQPGESGL